MQAAAVALRTLRAGRQAVVDVLQVVEAAEVAEAVVIVQPAAVVVRLPNRWENYMRV